MYILYLPWCCWKRWRQKIRRLINPSEDHFYLRKFVQTYPSEPQPQTPKKNGLCLGIPFIWGFFRDFLGVCETGVCWGFLRHYIHWSEVFQSLSISLILDTILLIWGDIWANTINYPIKMALVDEQNMKCPIVYLYVSTGSGLGVKNPLNDSGKQPADHPGGHPTSTGRKQPGGYPNRFRRLRSNKCWPPTKKHTGGLNWIWKMWQINSTSDLSWFVGNLFFGTWIMIYGKYSTRIRKIQPPFHSDPWSPSHRKKQLIAEMFADLHPDLDHLWKET